MLLKEKSTQIKEHPFWKASINIKSFFDSFTLVYIRLDSPTIILIHLHLFSVSSTLVNIRLHSSRLV